VNFFYHNTPILPRINRFTDTEIYIIYSPFCILLKKTHFASTGNAKFRGKTLENSQIHPRGWLYQICYLIQDPEFYTAKPQNIDLVFLFISHRLKCVFPLKLLSARLFIYFFGKKNSITTFIIFEKN
jgi:hypothetical protein